MSNFFEKIKDFLHDSIDFLTIIIIILIVGLIIKWRLNILFNNTVEKNIDNNSIIEETTNKNQESEDINIDDKNMEENNSEDNDIKVDDNEEKEEIILIDIPSGSSSEAVAEIMFENNLIENTSDFKEHAKKTYLEKSIKAGKYEIPQNASIEDILNIITK